MGDHSLYSYFGAVLLFDIVMSLIYLPQVVIRHSNAVSVFRVGLKSFCQLQVTNKISLITNLIISSFPGVVTKGTIGSGRIVLW